MNVIAAVWLTGLSIIYARVWWHFRGSRSKWWRVLTGRSAIGRLRPVRHVNPDGSKGGWVGRSALVAETAFVERSAVVRGFATVHDGACICKGARVFGVAEVYGDAIVGPEVRVWQGFFGGRALVLSSEYHKVKGFEVIM